MANRLKKKNIETPNPEELTTDKVADVTVAEVVKDERTTKIMGAVSLLFTIFLFVAFTSYLFTWQEDQDKVQKFGVKIFSISDVQVSNLLGLLGAYIAHVFIYKGFGIASFLFCTFFFVLGVNLLFGKKIFSIKRNIKYLITGLIVLSVAFTFMAAKAEFSWGGAVGELLNSWLIKWIGKIGTGTILLLSVFAYFIWRFNPTFTYPEQFFKNIFAPKPKKEIPTEDVAETQDNETINKLTVDSNDEEELQNFELKENINKEPTSNNRLKTEGNAVTVIMPDVEENNLPIFDIVDKPEIELNEVLVAEAPLSVNDKFANAENSNHDLSLEIKPITDENNSVEEQEIETTNKIEEELDEVDIDEQEENSALEVRSDELATFNYDPTLDLRQYQYPSLDLLETHGSEKIIHDPTELETNKNQIIATLKNYDISIQRISATVGPTVTLYEIVPAPGVRISRIKNLEDDIALSLAALGIRIIAPIPGKGTVGIEVPNVRKTVVSMKTLLNSDKFQNNNYALPIAIGKKIDNDNFIVDLTAMPHLLMAGATGQGKSVGLNAVLVSLLYKKHPSQLKFVLVDPKKVELSLYRIIEKHFLAKLPGE
ncbi:MAG TPA: DNA translocase FtsK 4TM domain-containing protein, partial [Chitinophagaceae bacterium]|nr:DNA translocase FtsK 4TM domain-containing protein [Chitinophagaceae bacterium]